MDLTRWWVGYILEEEQEPKGVMMMNVRYLDRPVLSEREAEFREAHRYVIELNQSIKRNVPANLNFEKLASEVPYRECMHDETVPRAVLFLPVIHGCSWKHKCGGCLNCGMAQGMNIDLPSALAVKPVLDRVATWVVRQKESPAWVCIYNEGSFLNPDELHQLAQRLILEITADTGFVRRITIESRPEFITEEALKTASQIATSHGVEIEIGQGVEVRNNFVRRCCINKGFSWDTFERKVKAIAECEGLRSLAYVLLKPPFLTEREAIDEAIRTIQECFRIGVDAVSLEAMSIQEWTLVEYLWLREFYRVPMLWSVIYVLSKVAPLGEVRIGGEPETYFPYSLRAAHNWGACGGKCNARIWDRFRRYNETHDPNYLTESSCECEEGWSREINKDRHEDGELENRVAQRIISVVQSSLSTGDYLTRKILTGGRNDYEGH